MGGCTSAPPQQWPVKVHVYRITENSLDSTLTALFGSGAYHTGVEIDGVEYAFGGGDGGGTGVFAQPPTVLPPQFAGATLKETLDMGGSTPLTRAELRQRLKQAEAQFPAASYDLVANNCNHFSAALLALLGCEAKLPPWVNSLAGKANAGLNALDSAAAGLLGAMALMTGAALSAVAREMEADERDGGGGGGGADQRRGSYHPQLDVGPVQIEELDVATTT